MQESTFQFLERLAPAQLNEICLRAMVLERVCALEPVGRRALAQRLKMREREVRAICESLREDGLLEMSAAGMSITQRAHPLLDEARSLSRTRLGTTNLETQLEHLLGITNVRIAPSGELSSVGRIAAQYIRSIMKPGFILAVSGGETVRAVAEAIGNGVATDVLVLPARGGFGEKVEVQADTLAEEFALRLGGKHRLLHIPDGLPESVLKEFAKIESVSQTLDDLRHTDVLLYGIAGVEKMASERQMHPQRARELTQAGAKAFVLGSWYDCDGRRLEGYDESIMSGWDFQSIPHVIAVAAGSGKAAAVIAVARHHAHELLVVDESCARSMLELLRAG